MASCLSYKLQINIGIKCLFLGNMNHLCYIKCRNDNQLGKYNDEEVQEFNRGHNLLCR